MTDICSCGVPPRIPRAPPDPSLVWHLISDEPFKQAEDCSWSPLTGESALPPRPPPFLVALSAFFLLLLLFSILCGICLIRRRCRGSHRSKGEAVSTEAILTGDHLWSYNSMKIAPNHSCSIYGNGSHGGSAFFQQNVSNTPASIRTARTPLRQSSTTLRIHADASATYVAPSEYAHNMAATLGRHYEEIPGLPYVVSCTGNGIAYTLGGPTGRPPLPPSRTGIVSSPSFRHSSRRPPPSIRPPPPPPDLSPNASSECSLPSRESPPGREEGRESGYGTAPSRQWRTPPGSAGKGDDLPLAVAVSPPHSMTYV